mmetsp:Transcript_39099/g.85081  ORF Transcript_39099/g.85081 Transcript_39099/m.85081 type:complete len:91 (-) Transcript_39099:53-325(-)
MKRLVGPQYLGVRAGYTSGGLARSAQLTGSPGVLGRSGSAEVGRLEPPEHMLRADPGREVLDAGRHDPGRLPEEALPPTDPARVVSSKGL